MHVANILISFYGLNAYSVNYLLCYMKFFVTLYLCLIFFVFCATKNTAICLNKIWTLTMSVPMLSWNGENLMVPNSRQRTTCTQWLVKEGELTFSRNKAPNWLPNSKWPVLKSYICRQQKWIQQVVFIHLCMCVCNNNNKNRLSIWVGDGGTWEGLEGEDGRSWREERGEGKI